MTVQHGKQKLHTQGKKRNSFNVSHWQEDLYPLAGKFSFSISHREGLAFPLPFSLSFTCRAWHHLVWDILLLVWVKSSSSTSSLCLECIRRAGQSGRQSLGAVPAQFDSSQSLGGVSAQLWPLSQSTAPYGLPWRNLPPSQPDPHPHKRSNKPSSN